MRSGKAGKFGNKKTTVGQRTFASKKEALRWIVLRDMEKKGEIQELQLQVPYNLTVNGRLVCKYLADFVYVQGGKTVVEDVKGRILPIYALKKKLMAACHGIHILET